MMEVKETRGRYEWKTKEETCGKDTQLLNEFLEFIVKEHYIDADAAISAIVAFTYSKVANVNRKLNTAFDPDKRL